MNKQSWR